ncbi:ABC transporter ATP-binding protein [Nitratireductor kimnyeongensis]|uniref:ABC transporter ATP-binding protein n=1 Tax=Nitratireductor kimnyeongensis TaxID=430679 RepID=A0ABW0T993_9HYPH|nr:ABC transporter ATP-binding protein [Nitratireductor kimnyeongensis]QZZ36458.1 ABC transporter ATP-binding protein [Nitratireductor kimnyeongensis]
MAEIRLCKLRHSYLANPESDDDYALKSVDLTWEEGLAYALLGPSGSGKTTMLNILSGLLTASEGKVLFDGRDVTALDARERNIAQVFQFPVVYETMTVGENLAFPLKTRNVPVAKIRERVGFIGEELGLTPLLNRKARGLSAEQKQRISLGRGLVREDVSAILLDEPLTVIDPAEKMALRRTLKAVQLHLGVKLIYVTHDQHEAMTLADRVVVMDNGEVVQVGSPEELFNNPAHEFVGYFIGTPGMNFISCEVDGDDLVVGQSRFALNGLSERLKAGNKDLTFGIRPEFVSLRDAGAAGTIPGSVTKVENHGDEQIVSVDIGPGRMLARVHQQVRVQVGNTVHLAPEPGAIRLFENRKRVDLPKSAFGGAS